MDDTKLPNACTESAQACSESRERRPTEKGLQYNREISERAFKSAISKWRSCVGKASILLSDETDVELIRKGRKSLERAHNEVQIAFFKLVELFSQGDSESNEATRIFESLEIDYQNFMCKIADRILELQASIAESSSYASTRSSRSRLSKRSKDTAASRRSDAVAEAAALKAKLKYLEAENKAKLEYDKITTKRKLEMAQAKAHYSCLDTSTDVEDFDMIDHQDLNIPVSCKTDLVEKYIREQASVNGQNRHIDCADFEPIVKAESAQIPPVIRSELPKGDVQRLNPSTETFSPVVQVPSWNQFKDSSYPVTNAIPSATEGSVLELTKSLAEQLSLNRLPPPEPGLFNGDPLKYPGWKSAFNTLIEQRKIPPSEKVHYLQKYLGESVKDVVANFFLLDTEDAYAEAKKLLDDRFGDPFVISNSFRVKLDKWPKIQSRDAYGLRKFADFLKQCYTAMVSVGSLGALDDERENRKLLAKLPDWLVSRWNRIAVQWREEKKASPPFKEFMLFMTREAKIACDPVSSVQSLKSEQVSTGFERVENKVSRNVGTFLSETSQIASSEVNENGQEINICALCQKNHDIDRCSEFLSKTVDDRKAFARQKGLCFGCLLSNHVAKFCKQRKTCKICNRLHPTSLHGDKYDATRGKEFQGSNSHSKPNANTTHSVFGCSSNSLLSQSDPGRMSSMILPVYVSHESCPTKEHLVYALLDSQSDTTFILENICSALGLSGADVELWLSTMHSENSLVKSSRINGLKVRGFNESVSLSLPVAYTRQIMPVNRSHIPSPETAESWPHLKALAGVIPPIQDCEVGLLIGYNCTKALIPRAVIAPKSDGPYAQRTDLGWGIVGITAPEGVLDDDSDPIGVSHNITVRHVDSCLVAKDLTVNNVVFSVKTKVKEVFSPVDVVQMMNLEFNERKDGIGLSIEDQKFLDIVDSGKRHVDGHYEMPLPVRDEILCLPYNKSMVLGRLKQLKARLQRNKEFYNHYCVFMNDMIDKGFAEKVPCQSVERNDGKVWYVPHHGVYNPKKPNKIRVVFDCSAQFQGDSLNKHLLQGPDLTNTLVAVLCRFRKERIAIVCDIEQMFFQFRVNTEGRDLLRFLWWENGVLDSEPSEFRMCVHLFGAASSPGCANFGLKQMASDFEDEFGKDVASFVRRDFYVDDGLTSRASVCEATSLIRRSKDMFSRGGLRLHKFASNSKSLLQQIPVEDRSGSFANIDLLFDTLPIEQT